MDNILIYIRSFIFNILFFLLSTIIGVTLLPFIISKTYTVNISIIWAKLTLILLNYICKVKIDSMGIEKFYNKNLLFAVRHESILDTILFLAYFPNIKYILKKELLYVPFYGLFVWRAGHIIINRKGGSSSLLLMMKKINECLKNNESIVLFPHGTRINKSSIIEIKSGVYAIYKYLNVPIIPVYISSGNIWDRKGFIKRPGKVKLSFYDAINPGYNKFDFLKILNSKLN